MLMAPDGVPPGDYEFEISAKVGSTVETIQFTLSLVNPCPLASQVTLTLKPSTFIDVTQDLGAPESF